MFRIFSERKISSIEELRVVTSMFSNDIAIYNEANTHDTDGFFTLFTSISWARNLFSHFAFNPHTVAVYISLICVFSFHQNILLTAAKPFPLNNILKCTTMSIKSIRWIRIRKNPTHCFHVWLVVWQFIVVEFTTFQHLTFALFIDNMKYHKHNKLENGRKFSIPICKHIILQSSETTWSSKNLNLHRNLSHPTTLRFFLDFSDRKPHSDK